ncbi:MAG: SH3 domain-containing protein [Chloroflexota bacterium]
MTRSDVHVEADPREVQMAWSFLAMVRDGTHGERLAARRALARFFLDRDQADEALDLCERNLAEGDTDEETAWLLGSARRQRQPTSVPAPRRALHGLQRLCSTATVLAIAASATVLGSAVIPVGGFASYVESSTVQPLLSRERPVRSSVRRSSATRAPVAVEASTWHEESRSAERAEPVARLVDPDQYVSGISPPAIESSLRVVGVGAQGLQIRSAPVDGRRIGTAPEGARLAELADRVERDGSPWHLVRTPEGVEGWVSGRFVSDGAAGSAVSADARVRDGRFVRGDLTWLSDAGTARSLTPNQLADGIRLSRGEALAACAPAAAVALARSVGEDHTLDDVVDLARVYGWSSWGGMSGPVMQVRMLSALGVSARLDSARHGELDWDRIAREVLAGRPVLISTFRHYFVAEGYDPELGAFDFGNSSAVLASARGRRWFSPDQLPRLGMGYPEHVIFLAETTWDQDLIHAGATDSEGRASPIRLITGPL